MLSIVDQPHFSKDANVFTNGVAGAISLLSVSPSARTYLWWVFLFWCAYLVILSYVLMFLRTRALENEPSIVQLVTRVNRQIGRPEALFSAFFVWGVTTQFTQDAAAYRALFVFWVAFIILNMRQVSEYLGSVLSRPKPTSDRLVGSLRTFSSPRTVECEVPVSAPSLSPGSTARIHSPSGQVAAEGVVVDDRILDGVRIARLGLTSFGEGWNDMAKQRHLGLQRRVEIHPLHDQGTKMRPVGLVGPGSTIGDLRVPVNPDLALVEGELLAVDLPTLRAYYQVVAAILKEQLVEGTQRMQLVDVHASQLGTWQSGSCIFRPVTWVAPAGGLVLRPPPGAAGDLTLPSGRLRIGSVPNSEFPVHVDLNDVVTHNTALIGVTGSGKSYLAFWIIQGLVRYGVKILVLDISRQHWVFLQKLKPTQLKTTEDIDGWFESESLIGIHQFAQSRNYPSTTAGFAEGVFKKLEETVQLKAGVNEPARVCVVFEEAHSLIPEWNQVAQKGDEAHVNKTARTVLQGRKYGLGCLVISQRTANVTKTILNQCNTIIALQSFDQTGLDFLSNYMGTAYANVISTLPYRHAVLVGKASSSTRPVLFEITDLNSEWSDKNEGPSDGSAAQ